MTAEDIAEAAAAVAAVECPWCKAEAGRPCTRPILLKSGHISTEPTSTHWNRVRRYRTTTKENTK